MTTQEILESTLAKAVANLQRAVDALAVPGCDQSAANEDLNKARASCRSAYAALNGLARTTG